MNYDRPTAGLDWRVGVHIGRKDEREWGYDTSSQGQGNFREERPHPGRPNYVGVPNRGACHWGIRMTFPLTGAFQRTNPEEQI